MRRRPWRGICPRRRVVFPETPPCTVCERYGPVGDLVVRKGETPWRTASTRENRRRSGRGSRPRRPRTAAARPPPPRNTYDGIPAPAAGTAGRRPRRLRRPHRAVAVGLHPRAAGCVPAGPVLAAHPGRTCARPPRTRPRRVVGPGVLRPAGGHPARRRHPRRTRDRHLLQLPALGHGTHAPCPEPPRQRDAGAGGGHRHRLQRRPAGAPGRQPARGDRGSRPPPRRTGPGSARPGRIRPAGGVRPAARTTG